MIRELCILTELSSKILGGKFRDNRNFRDQIMSLLAKSHLIAYIDGGQCGHWGAAG
jgi:hypothetical protein